MPRILQSKFPRLIGARLLKTSAGMPKAKRSMTARLSVSRAVCRLGIALKWIALGILSEAICCIAAEPLIREVSQGVLEVGAVRVEKAVRTLSFDAEVNMAEGTIEYALVTRTGKTHESVFSTAAEPQHIQLAAMLLGIRDAAKFVSASSNQPSSLRGDEVTIEVKWAADGKPRTAPLEEFVRHATTRQPLLHGPWVYNGSSVWEGRFLAQTEGSIVAIMDDRDALVNNPRPGREDDTIWRVNERVAPPKGTPVRVVIRCPPAKLKQ